MSTTRRRRDGSLETHEKSEGQIGSRGEDCFVYKHHLSGARSRKRGSRRHGVQCESRCYEE